MRLDGFDIFVIEVPCRTEGPPELSRGVRTILVRLRDETGLQGWGESPVGDGAEPDSLNTARDSLREVILPALATFEYGSLESVSVTVGELLEEVQNNSYAAFCGAELALLDLAGRRLRRSVGKILGPRRHPSVHYGGLISAEDDTVIRSQAAALRRAGVRDVKLRVGNDLAENLFRLDIARQILGPDVELRITADGRWDSAEAVRQLEAMMQFRLAGVEQPVPAADIDGLAAVTAAAIVPVIARDSVARAEDAMELAARRACDAISISISRCGGLVNASRIQSIARDAGLGCQLGADASEVGLVAAAGRLFAICREGIRWCEFAPSLSKMADCVIDPPLAPDLAEPSVSPRGPGLGIRVIEAAVHRYASQRISIS